MIAEISQYLLVRPYPSLRILFCSPALRVPGILQSPFLSRIGGSARVRDELTTALSEGRGVTAKVRWVSGRNGEEEGRARWIHCTPLLGHNGAVGVWMIVLIDDENSAPARRFREAPPVAIDLGPSRHGMQDVETDVSISVNGHPQSDRTEEYAKQTAVPTKHSQPMAQRMAGMDRSIASLVRVLPTSIPLNRTQLDGASTSRPATSLSQRYGSRRESDVTASSLQSFALG